MRYANSLNRTPPPPFGHPLPQGARVSSFFPCLLCASVSLWFNSSALPNARHAIAQMRHREKKKFVRRGQACCRASCLPDTDTNRTPDGGAHQAEPRGRDGLDEALCALQDRPSAQQAAPRTCLGTSTSVVGSPCLFARSARRRSRDRLRRVDESGSQAVTPTRPFAPASCNASF